MANLAAQHAQENAATSQFFATSLIMQSNLNIIMQELQSIKHQMNYSNVHSPTVPDRLASELLFVPPLPPQHMPIGTQHTIQCNPTLQ